jgi:hypothetical protein
MDYLLTLATDPLANFINDNPTVVMLARRARKRRATTE